MRSPGKPLDPETRMQMESRLGHDFASVRVHADSEAGESAQAVEAKAYTVGRNIVFAPGMYAPSTEAGRQLLAHELVHVVQQRGQTTLPSPPAPVIREDEHGFRIPVVPQVEPEPPELENEAHAIAREVGTRRDESPSVGYDRPYHSSRKQGLSIQRVRVPMPTPLPLCGRTVTHIDIEPPRWRPLVPCLPPTVLVNRLNIVGRQVGPTTTGLGRVIFNLHVGYYRDPVTGRLCAIVDDSMACIAPRCVHLGCFLTLREVLDAIRRFLSTILDALGLVLLIILAIIIALLTRGARLQPSPAGVPFGPGGLPGEDGPTAASGGDIGEMGEAGA
jgi:Domain of unknown function (DUF4157)